MTLIADRVRDTLIIFFKFFAIDPKFRYNGIPVSNLLPHMARDLARMINDNPDQAEVIINWLSEAIFYCRGDTNNLPDFEIEFKV